MRMTIYGRFAGARATRGRVLLGSDLCRAWAQQSGAPNPFLITRVTTSHPQAPKPSAIREKLLPTSHRCATVTGMQRSRWRKAAALSACFLLAAQWSGNAAEGPQPGLPRHTGSGVWAGVAQTAMAETAQAKQWVRVPFQIGAAFSATTSVLFPPSDPRSNRTVSTNYVYLVAPAGAEHNYGVAPPFTVRTVAFGAIPVEASVQLVQRRTTDGLPEPLIMSANTDTYRLQPPGRPSPRLNTDALIEDVLAVRLTGLVVDGVDLKLSGRCQTAEPGKLKLLGRGYWQGDPEIDNAKPWLTGNFVATQGGLLTGTIDIPAFAGCTTASGDDVSPLVTTAVSGPSNPLSLNVSAPICATPGPNQTIIPPPPGATTPSAADCDPDRIPPELPYPDRTP